MEADDSSKSPVCQLLRTLSVVLFCALGAASRCPLKRRGIFMLMGLAVSNAKFEMVTHNFFRKVTTA